MISAEKAYDIVLDSPLGRLGVRYQDEKIIRLDYLGNTVLLKREMTRLGQQVAKQLNDYFNSALPEFTLPVDLHGTAFQCRVWQALVRIPAGTTLTYGELADQLDSGARAVGNACRNNPVSIIIPCHRVVSRTGIGGYSGKTDGREIRRKRWLLGHEGALKTSHTTPITRLHQIKQRNLHV